MIANFWTRWLLLVDNFLKSHQIETKNSTIHGLLQKIFFEIAVWRVARPISYESFYLKMVALDGQTPLLTPQWNMRPEKTSLNKSEQNFK